jgi:hypothetical protein
MIIKAQVIADQPNSYVGKKGVVNEQRLALLDVNDVGHSLVNTFDYTLSDTEKAAHAGKLGGKLIRLAIHDVMFFGGRLRVRGELVEVLK